MARKILTLEELKEMRKREGKKLLHLMGKGQRRKLSEKEKVVRDIKRIKAAQTKKHMEGLIRMSKKLGGKLERFLDATIGQEQKPRKKSKKKRR